MADTATASAAKWRGADICGVNDAKDWLVVGWFTPDYRPLAEKLAANLAAHGAAHHLFARPPLPQGWDTSPKPSVVMDAMDAYPGKTVILMDVDCFVSGDISPVAQFDGDVSFPIGPHERRHGHRVLVGCGSRVVAFRPTPQARAFAEQWKCQIEMSDFKHDEYCMALAYFASLPHVRVAPIDPVYAGVERWDKRHAVVRHDSAHRPARRHMSMKGFRGLLRMIEQPFRSGRSQIRKGMRPST